MLNKKGAICIVDTFPQKGLVKLAIAQMLRNFEPRAVYIFSDEILLNGAKHYHVPLISDMSSYNNIMLTQIPRSIEEDYVIIFQWDGFALNREMFSDEFLNYDYIGAPWPSAPAGFEVGNGGFSLRSRRLLDRLLLLEAHLISDVLSDQPEDLRICVHIRNILTKLGIVFAPTEIARKFSFEWVPRQGTFGFHGVFNLPLLLKKEALTTHMPEILGRVKNPQLLKAMHLNARLVGANSFKTT